MVKQLQFDGMMLVGVGSWLRALGGPQRLASPIYINLYITWVSAEIRQYLFEISPSVQKPGTSASIAYCSQRYVSMEAFDIKIEYHTRKCDLFFAVEKG